MFKKLKFNRLFFLFFLALVIVTFSFWLKSQKKDSAETMSPPSANNFAKLETYTNDLLARKGVGFTLDSIKKMFQDQKVTLAQCHNLVHLAGHKAYSVYSNNLEKLSQYNLTLCGGAFQHGIEAEIALRPKDSIETLHKFCTILHEKHVGTNCYHGAGHAYLGENLNVIKSLSNCDKISSEVERSVYPCYEGVFSEYAFQIAGVDGDTGLPFSSGPTMKMEAEYPMDYCQTLDSKYQLACSAQLSRIVLQSQNVDNPLKLCVKSSYSLDIQFGCLRIVSAAIAQQELTKSNTVKVPSFILALSPNLKRAYIIGIAGEYQAFVTSGAKKDWQSICSSFTEENDKKECEKSMNGSFDIMS